MFLPSKTHGINYFLSGHSSLVHTLSYPILQISHLCVPLQDGTYNWASLMSQMVKKLPANAEGTRNVEFSPWAGKILWRRKWQPTPVLLPGKSHGQRSLVGYRPWGHKESDTTERLYVLTYYDIKICLSLSDLLHLVSDDNLCFHPCCCKWHYFILFTAE